MFATFIHYEPQQWHLLIIQEKQAYSIYKRCLKGWFDLKEEKKNRLQPHKKKKKKYTHLCKSLLF